MKRILLIAALSVCCFASAQIVNIPDPFFKSRLLESNTTSGIAADSNSNLIVVDTNGDGELQVSEAQNIRRLYLQQAGISDITGITSFSNLEYFYCTYNSGLTSADFSGLSNLSEIVFSNNYNVVSMNFNGLTSLEKLNVAHTDVTTIDVSSCTNLKQLNFQLSELTALDVSTLTDLEGLYLYGNDITSLDVSMLPELTGLGVDDNQLTSLDVSSNPLLTHLSCFNNHLTSLNVTGCNSLISLRCETNELTAIDLEGKTVLGSFIANNNAFTSLDFSECPVLAFLDVNTTLISTLDLRYQPITELHISHCPNLTSLFIKNDSFDFGGESQYYFEDIHLTSICADEEEFQAVQDLLSGVGVTGVAMTSDCALDAPAATGGFKLAETKLYPNPASGKVHVSAGAVINTIGLYDIQGRLLYAVNPESTDASIDIAKHPAGVYLLKITAEGKSLIKKIIKE